MKFTIFREMLDYMAHICKVTDADMNYCGNILIEGETSGKVITFEVIIKNKEEKKDAEELE